MDKAMFKETIHKSLDSVIEKYEEIKELNFCSDGNMKEASCYENVSVYTKAFLKEKLKDVTNNVVYVISTPVANFSFTEDNIESDYKNNKNKDYSMSRFHKNKKWEPKDNKYCLYVGSSKGNVVTRLIQHLGIYGDNKDVYALHLKQWFPKAKIKIDVRKFTGGAEKYLQEIEDLLWDYYKPIFGRKGAK